jgi:hypothetical protein
MQVSVKAALMSVFTLAVPVYGQEQLKGLGEVAVVMIGDQAPTFMDGYLWKQIAWEGTPQPDGTLALTRSEPWGGRVVGGVGFGRFGIEARVDVSGLKDQFDVNNPATYQSVEAYGMAHWIAAAPAGIVQIGPAVMAGSISSFESGASFHGFGLDVYGVGARFAVKGSEFEVFAARTSFLRDDPKVRAVAVLHLCMTSQMALVGDAVSGEAGFIRFGIAVRAF